MDKIYSLLNQDVELAQFKMKSPTGFDQGHVIVEKGTLKVKDKRNYLFPFIMQSNITEESLQYFLNTRDLPHRLSTFDLMCYVHGLRSRKEKLLAFFAMSIKDNVWIKDTKLKVSYDDINIYENELNLETIMLSLDPDYKRGSLLKRSEVELKPKSFEYYETKTHVNDMLERVALSSGGGGGQFEYIRRIYPENLLVSDEEWALGGSQPKFYQKDMYGIKYIHKANKPQVLCECLASLILTSLKVPHVEYQLFDDRKFHSALNETFTAVCKMFTSREKGVISLADILYRYNPVGTLYGAPLNLTTIVNLLEATPVSMQQLFEKIIYPDFVLRNIDRNFNNVLFTMNNLTGEITGLQDTLDNALSLYSHFKGMDSSPDKIFRYKLLPDNNEVRLLFDKYLTTDIKRNCYNTLTSLEDESSELRKSMSKLYKHVECPEQLVKSHLNYLKERLNQLVTRKSGDSIIIDENVGSQWRRVWINSNI